MNPTHSPAGGSSLRALTASSMLHLVQEPWESSRKSPVPCGHAIARNQWINLSGSSWGEVTFEILHLVRFRGEGVLVWRLQQGVATGKHAYPNSIFAYVHT